MKGQPPRPIRGLSSVKRGGLGREGGVPGPARSRPHSGDNPCDKVDFDLSRGATMVGNALAPTKTMMSKPVSARTRSREFC